MIQPWSEALAFSFGLSEGSKEVIYWKSSNENATRALRAQKCATRLLVMPKNFKKNDREWFGVAIFVACIGPLFGKLQGTTFDLIP